MVDEVRGFLDPDAKSKLSTLLPTDEDSKSATWRTRRRIRKWRLTVRQDLLVTPVCARTEELVCARCRIFTIKTHPLTSVEEGDRIVHALKNASRLTSENWYPVYIHSIWIYDAHYPEIDIAAIRRKDDVLIDIGCILHNRPFAIGGNVMNQQAPTLRIPHDSRQIIAIRRDRGHLYVFTVYQTLDGIVLKRHLLVPGHQAVCDSHSGKDCHHTDRPGQHLAQPARTRLLR